MTTTTVASETRRTRSPFAAGERLLQRRRVGPVDRAPIGGILALLPQLPDWPAATAHRTMRLRGATTILDWLLTHPGEGWQDRWMVSGADRDASWIGTLAPDDTRLAVTKRQEHVAGLACLLMCRVVLPSYDFLAAYRAKGLLDRARNIMRPEMFARLENAATERGLSGRDRGDALSVITKIVLHTGTDVDALTADDVLEVYAWSVHSQRRQVPGLHVAWDLLGDIGVIPAGLSLRAALRRGQRSTAELVGDYDIRCRPIRDVFIRYLDERRPALDYNSLISLAGELAGTFWADIERHHPGIDTLHLPDEIAQAWKERVRVVTATDGTVRPRKNIHALLMRVRAFYLDIQQWALEDPSWVPWAVPSPVRKGDTLGYEKARRKTVAAMHQRVRERLPHLPALADAAGRCRAETAALLAAATEREPGEVFDHAGTRYRRKAPKSADLAARHQGSPAVTVKNLVTGEAINLTRREDEAFWAWAIIETLRLSGVRLEELLEITHLALVSYQPPGPGEIVPLLQIVPSKSNEERLLLVDPELASVLATIITRLRARNGGTVPLVARYDHHERVTGPLLPHLFQRARGARREVISPGTVYKLINTALAAAGLKDATGQPLVYRPHDFRRCFTTDAVTGGLPVHIAARLLGHKRLTTTETYLAVFQDDLIRSYRAFLDTRRATRPTGEYREPTDQEWQEFQRHFQMRKVALGTCGRPYGSSCQHEHACLRCAMLRISPQQRPRLIEIIRNLHERITEARMNGWLGEVQGLQVSLEAAKRKLASLDRSIERNRRNGPADLGMPIIRDPNDRRDPAPPNPQKYTVNGQKLIRKMAYGNIYSNSGAMTPGASAETADGMSEDKIDQIIGAMRYERYRFSPARRVYIPKKNGKLRPLGLPSWSDKLVGEVVRLILEAIYEPCFSSGSHGFRKGRGCHTALRDIRETWTGTVWFIEGDISDCFGSFDHEILLGILAEKIHDQRFLRLISNMLKAGYLEDWEYRDTLSGVPQGGVVSPILSNIYLDKLDKFVEQELIPQYTRGARRKSNPEYHRRAARLRYARRKGNRALARDLKRQLRALPYGDPMDPGYRRLQYIRYADDHLLGFTGPKAEAEQIKARLAVFLRETLGLELNSGKTLITHGRTAPARFLGYDIIVQHCDAKLTRGRRAANGKIALRVPPDVVKAQCARYRQHGKPWHRSRLQNLDDYDIVRIYGAEYRGVVNYYLLAQNVSHLSTLEWHAVTSMLKTLAARHRSSVTKMAARHAAKVTTDDGPRRCFEARRRREGKKDLVARFGGIPLRQERRAVLTDPAPVPVPAPRKELIHRLRKRRCELCESGITVAVHQVAGLSQLGEPGPGQPAWAALMARMRRKTLIVCAPCHEHIHANPVTHAAQIAGEPGAPKGRTPGSEGGCTEKARVHAA